MTGVFKFDLVECSTNGPRPLGTNDTRHEPLVLDEKEDTLIVLPVVS